MSNDHVLVQISVDNVGITRNGYGMPLIVSHNAGVAFGSDRIRTYQSKTAVSEDFATDSPEYRTASAFFAQTPKPPRIAIGRADSDVTQRYTLDSGTPVNLRVYEIDIEGEGFDAATASYTAFAAATQEQIHAGLVDALNSAPTEALVYPDDTFTAAASDIVTNTAHGLLTGDGPFQLTSSGTLPAGLSLLTNYWIIKIDADTFYFATSLSNALHGVRVDITGTGSGTHTISDTASTERLTKTYTAAHAAFVYPDDTFTAAASDVVTNVAHGLLTGDGPFQLTSSGTLPAGLAGATDYWIVKLDADTFKFASTLANAIAATPVVVDITDAGTGTHTISDTSTTVRPSDPFTVTADAPNAWFSLALAREDIKNGSLKIAQTHASPGSSLTDDLDNILEADVENSWYQVHTFFNSHDYVADVAEWVEGVERTYVFDSCETDIIKTAYVAETTTDIGTTLFDLGYSATMGCYHSNPASMFAACWMGRWLPTSPGAATAKFKTLSGVSPIGFTDTEKTNLRARRMNSYVREFGRPITFEGTVFSTIYRFLDVRRDVDWLTDEMRKSIFGVLAGADKVPYTPAGISMIEGAMRGSVDLAVRQDVLAEGTTAVEMPVFEEIEDADKSDRILRNAKFSGTLTGAVHAAIPVLGVVTF